MSPAPSNLHLAWARLLFRALATAGVRHVVISPGSRSTPLVLAAAAEEAVTCHTIIDERSAAFFALGQARVTGKPTVLVCTSGTAGAHYLPAIIEASESLLPLVAITADRPWELQDVAAPQTVDQAKLFGNHVRRFFDLGLPDASPAALRGVPRIAAQAVATSLGPQPGPVHVNAHFRKPLEPVEALTPEPWEKEVEALLARGAPAFHSAPTTINRDAAEQLARACLRARRGIIACGPSPLPRDNDFRVAAGALSLATGFPILAEATSQARFGPKADGVTVVGAFDALLRAGSIAEAPDLVIELGSTPVSSAYAAWMEKHASVPRWVVAPHGWHDPFNSATAVVQAAPAAFASEVAAWVTAADDAPSRTWASAWTDADARAWSLVEREWAEPRLTEASIPRLLTQALPEGSFLIAGNSGSVRDLDAFAPPGGPDLHVLHQRGASGIDGLVSGAAGVRSLVEAPVLLYLGDVSLLHDLGALAVARSARRPLVIVVVQNDGGRLFEQLPIGSKPGLAAALSDFFVTPHGLSFEHAAAMFGLAYRREDTPGGLDRALTAAVRHEGCTLLEAVVPPEDGTERRKRLVQALGAELSMGSR